MKRAIQIFLLVAITSLPTYSGSFGRNGFGRPFLSDSSSVVMIPVFEASNTFSSKLSAGNSYTNIIVYDYKTKQSKRLFKKSTKITEIITGSKLNGIDGISNCQNEEIKNIERNEIFILAKDVDTNDDGEFDYEDPTILYLCKKNGTGLIKVTDSKISVDDVYQFYDQNMALIKYKVDSDNDREFTNDDDEYGYLRLDLKEYKIVDTLELK